MSGGGGTYRKLNNIAQVQFHDTADLGIAVINTINEIFHSAPPPLYSHLYTQQH